MGAEAVTHTTARADGATLAELAPHLRRLTREEFQRMADLGFFEDERVELLRGVVVTMTPPNPTRRPWTA